MSEYKLAVVPVGRIDVEELEAALARVSRVVRASIELRGALPVPQGIEDDTRRQFRTSLIMTRLRAMVPQLGPGKLIGPGGALDDKPPVAVDGYLFVTDVDLFTANRDGVFAALVRSKSLAVVSVRRLREAFYKRKADANKQRNRQVKEIIRMVIRLRGHPECPTPQCVMAGSKMVMDLDIKEEKLCRDCSARLFEGTIRI